VTARYHQADGLHAVGLEGGVLVWDATAETLHRLNESAGAVWSCCDDWRTVDEITDALPAKGADAHGVRDDVRRCVEEMRAAGLLVQR
jgi:hypothetical protein